VVAKKQFWTGIAAAVAMLMMILDTKVALSGAQAGVELCLRTVIPSLFPFIVITILVNSNLTGYRIPFLKPIARLCGIPQGAEALLLLGLLGGYPVGAQGVSEAYHSRRISRNDAQRLLGFCNNAGPAFIFGMLGCMYEKPLFPWMLWGIHILSAILVGCILPNKSKESCQLSTQSVISTSQALEKGLKTIGIICGWIILFRVLIVFLERWIFWFIPKQIQVLIIGLLELSNGCFAVHSITSQGLRFVICAAVLAFGGICVYMQTISVTGDLHGGMYFPGKIIQTCISILIAIFLQPLVFSQSEQQPVSFIICIIPAIVILIATGLLYMRKKL
jgi:hypothetical protein